jgi:hydroxypyruvate isomerase
MPFKFAPNISWLFPELPFKERAIAAARAGFEAVEFGFPTRADTDLACREYGLAVALFNQDVPVWKAGERGYLVDPARRTEFRLKLDDALQVAQRLNAQKIMLPSGEALPGIPRETQRACMVDNLRYAAPLGAAAGVLFTIELLNNIDNPGYFLVDSREALEIVREVDHPSVKFQLDTYHIQLMEGGQGQSHLESLMRYEMPWIGHIQFADYPGRHEPGTGTLNFQRLSAIAEEAGYRGYIGLEYKPLAPGAAALAWAGNFYGDNPPG